MTARRLSLGLITTVLAASFGIASAVRPPEFLAGQNGVELRDGTAARSARQVSWTTPKTMHAMWSGFVLSEGVAWRAQWDRATDVPLRIFGGSIAADGAVDDPAIAARIARSVLARHIALLAPGASTRDFVLTKNQLDALGNRSVVFAQRHQGYKVLNGQLSFRFQNDRLYLISSTALPHVSIPASAARVDKDDAEVRSLDWIRKDFGSLVRPASVKGPVIFPVVRNNGTIEYHLAYKTRIDATSPRGLWDVYTDATTGQLVARHQRLMFGQGQLGMRVPERWPGSGYINLAASLVDAVVDGSNTTADVNGFVEWGGGGSVSVSMGVSGDLANINNQAGGEASISGSVSDGGTFVWNESENEFADAQLTAYAHVNLVKQFALSLNPGLNVLNQPITVNVNLNDVCNAFYSGQDNSINFFRQGSTQGVTCSNTGRMADVVYHEFGHFLHANSLIDGQFESAMSEGAGDYLSATITGDPAMGRGFFLNNEPLRHIDPPGEERVYPDDFQDQSGNVFEAHTSGQVYGGTMWDLRTALAAELGDVEGIALADDLFYATLQHASGTTSVYTEVLAADDNDGNIGNGTPHKCTIDEVFATHGLAEGGGPGGAVGVDTPVLDGFNLSFNVIEPSGACEVAGVTSAEIAWRLRDNTAESGTVAMAAEGNTYSGSIPAADPGSVIQYQVRVAFENGSETQFPQNPADPFYELFVGDVEVLYCTDFASDPTAEGWTADGDWEWGTPAGLGGDPDAAYSGSSAFGQDLTNDGTYLADSTATAASPLIDTQGYDVVRLQYRRWLNVEDSGCDVATIYANDQIAWQNASQNPGQVCDGQGDLQHEDREWRFQDVDLSSYVQGGQVQVKFDVVSDPGLQFGGWNIDDFCVVGFSLEEQGPICGDEQVEAPETCDDGNTVDGDGCSATCTDEDGGGDGDGDGVGDGNPATGDGATGGCGCEVGTRTGTTGTTALLLTLAAFALIITRRLRQERRR